MGIRFEYIDREVKRLVKKFGTRCPFTLCRLLKIMVISEDLGQLYGYYTKHFNIKMIHLNERFDKNQLRVVCGHELGHAQVHPNENTPKLREYSLNSEWLVEMEANYFMLKLLIDGSHQEYPFIDTAKKILKFYGLPLELEDFFIRHSKRLLNE